MAIIGVRFMWCEVRMSEQCVRCPWYSLIVCSVCMVGSQWLEPEVKHS